MKTLAMCDEMKVSVESKGARVEKRKAKRKGKRKSTETTRRKERKEWRK